MRLHSYYANFYVDREANLPPDFYSTIDSTLVLWYTGKSSITHNDNDTVFHNFIMSHMKEMKKKNEEEDMERKNALKLKFESQAKNNAPFSIPRRNVPDSLQTISITDKENLQIVYVRSTGPSIYRPPVYFIKLTKDLLTVNKVIESFYTDYY